LGDQNNGLAKTREPGKFDRCTFRLPNDLFNAINAAALTKNNGIGVELAERLERSLLVDEMPRSLRLGLAKNAPSQKGATVAKIVGNPICRRSTAIRDAIIAYIRHQSFACTKLVPATTFSNDMPCPTSGFRKVTI
jgi:hypothetical protein